MAAQCLNRVIVSRQFRLGQTGMDFTVTDVVQQDCWSAFAAFELWDQVVQALWNARWDRSQAQWAERSIAAVRHDP